MNPSRPTTDTRILVIGKRGGILHWPEHVVNACRRLGMETRFLALNHQNFADRAAKKVIGLFGRERAERYTARQLEKLLTHFRPTLLIFPDIIAIPTPVQAVLIRHKSEFRGVSWIGDFFPDSVREYNRFIDRFYFTDSYLQEQAEKLGLNRPSYLPLAVDETLFVKYAKPFEQRKDGILFVGAFSQNRYEVIKAIEHPVVIYGKGWDKPLPPQHEVHPHNIPLEKVAQLYGAHKYVLNIINSNNIKNGLNMRCFEATAAGAVLITDEVKDLGRCFEVGEEVWTYRNAQEIDTTVKTPMDSNSAHNLAAKGTCNTLDHHTYKHRVSAILRDE